jgi:hypothetical protein
MGKNLSIFQKNGPEFVRGATNLAPEVLVSVNNEEAAPLERLSLFSTHSLPYLVPGAASMKSPR